MVCQPRFERIRAKYLRNIIGHKIESRTRVIAADKKKQALSQNHIPTEQNEMETQDDQAPPHFIYLRTNKVVWTTRCKRNGITVQKPSGLQSAGVSLQPS